VEAKKSVREADLGKDCEEAIRHIITQKYAEGLDGYEKVICYGAAFYQKQALVRKC
jgi:hypothetical protein